MAIRDDILSEISTIIGTQWQKRVGRQVPSSSVVALAGGAVEIEATFLYADLADSSKMANYFDQRITAKIIKSFLATSTRLIKANGGEIRSFDGDRVMGIFIGESQCTSAAKCALQIKWCVDQIKSLFEAKYETVRSAPFSIRHGVGIDCGSVLSVRGGVRGTNDLIWIGRAPNLAAKLSDLRDSPYSTIITKAVFDNLNEIARYGGIPRSFMWEIRNWNYLGETIIVYRSSWHWKP